MVDRGLQLQRMCCAKRRKLGCTDNKLWAQKSMRTVTTDALVWKRMAPFIVGWTSDYLTRPLACERTGVGTSCFLSGCAASDRVPTVRDVQESRPCYKPII